MTIRIRQKPIVFAKNPDISENDILHKSGIRIIKKVELLVIFHIYME